MIAFFSFLTAISFLTGVSTVVILSSAKDRKIHPLMWVYAVALFAISFGSAMLVQDLIK